MSDEPRIIAGRYRVVGPLGSGGMGVVLRARDVKLDRDVAVKMLPPATMRDPTARARLLREARATAAFNHPNVVHVYDVGETEDGGAYLVMELVSGKTMRELLATEWPLDERVKALVTAARALAAAHRVGIIHRDVKPDNLMIRDDGRVVVMDFGLAIAATPADPTAATLSPLTAADTVVGTLAYLSPEQARAETVDARSDEFSFATTAFEVLTARLPWLGPTQAAILTALLTGSPARPSDMGLAPALDDVFARAFAKRPEDRHPSLDAFAAALEVACTGLRSQPPLHVAIPVSTGELDPAGPTRTLDPAMVTAPRRARIGRTRAVAGLGVVLAAGAVAVGLALRGAAHPEPANVKPTAIARDSIVACPVLEATEKGAPAPWLGAAAAARLCSELAYRLGGSSERTVPPVELLGLPPHPSEEIGDPYETSEAREKTLAAARARGLPILDGHIDASDEALHFFVVLRAADGKELGRAEANGTWLLDSVGAVLDALVVSGAVPRLDTLDEDSAHWLATTDPRLASTTVGLQLIQSELEPEAPVCDRARRERKALAAHEEVIAVVCDHVAHPPPYPPLPPDAPTWDVAMRAMQDFWGNNEGDLDARIAELDRAIAREPSKRGRSRLFQAKAWLQTRKSGYTGGRDSYLASVDVDPRLPSGWGHMVTVSVGTNGMLAAARASCAWEPDAAYSWIGRSRAPGTSPADAIRYASRAFRLSPSAFSARTYSNLLLAAAHTDDARAVGSRLSRSSLADDRFAAETIALSLSAGEAQLGAAYTKGVGLLKNVNDLGKITRGDRETISQLRELAWVLGRTREFGDFVADFVLAEPIRIQGGNAMPEILNAAVGASPDKARAATHRLKDLSRAGFFSSSVQGADALLDCATAIADGGAKPDMNACRPALAVAQAVRGRFGFITDAFDRAKEYDVAERVDALPTASAAMGGATPAQVRAARRAIARGDAAKAHELAKTIVDAWSVADAPIPSVDEMKRVLSR